MTELSFEFTGVEKVNVWGVTVKQIRATRDIQRRGIRMGDVGGWIASTELPNGNARVSGDAWVSGDAQVFGNAQVFGDARVSGDAWVERDTDFIVVGPIGSEGVHATLVRAEDGKHILTVGCWTGTLGTLMEEVERRRVGWCEDEATQDMWVAQYRTLKALGEAMVPLWEGTQP